MLMKNVAKAPVYENKSLLAKYNQSKEEEVVVEKPTLKKATKRKAAKKKKD